MSLIARIGTRQVRICRDIIDRYKGHAWILDRVRANVERSSGPALKEITIEEFWRWYVTAIATTLTRSAIPGNPIQQLIEQSDRYPALSWSSLQMVTERATEKIIYKSFRTAGQDADHGVIFGMTMKSRQLARGHKLLQNGGWEEIRPHLQKLQRRRQRATIERDIARRLLFLSGVGPKQARNILQMLGLTRYEIPLDSRVSAFLRTNLKFPVHVSAAKLGNELFYCAVLDWVQALCKRAEVYPTVFDICAFIHGDGSPKTKRRGHLPNCRS